MSVRDCLSTVVRTSGRLLVSGLLLIVPCLSVAAPGDILFSDDFESGFGNWTEDSFGGGDASIGTETANSPNSSMRLRWDGVSAISDAFDAAVPAANLSVWIRRGDDSFSENPDNGEDLVVEYLNNSNNWIALETFAGGDTPGEVFDRQYSLPADALHGSLRIRFRYLTGSGSDFDYWHVDDVVVIEAETAFIGSGTGLNGDYCNRDSSNETVPCTSSPDVSRIDPTVDFENGDPGWPAPGIGDDTFSVRWTGQIQAQFTEDYRIHTISDDGIRVFIDLNQDGDFDDAGETVIDNYTDHAPTEDISSPISLVRAERYDIVIEYYENGGGQVARLLWSSPSTAPQSSPVVVLQSQLYPESTPSPQADYRFDEDVWNGTPDEVLDSSGNNRHGTAQGGATTDDADPAIAGDPGTCGYGTFDGSDDYVEISNLSDLLNGTASLTFWIRTTQNGDDTGWRAPGVIGVEEAGGADDIFWGWIDASGNIGISVGNDYNNDQKSATEINDGSWHHVALTRDAGSGDTKIYVDGVLETSGNSGTGIIGNTYSSIGRIEDTGGSPEYFAGELDEVRIYDSVLSDSEVIAIRDSVHPCDLSGLVSWHRLDEEDYDNTAGEVIDSSGNGNDGQTVGNVGSYPFNDPDAQVCSGAVIPRNTSDNVIDAVDTGVDPEADVGNAGSINFWYRADTRWRENNYDRMLFDASEIPNQASSRYFYLTLHDGQQGGGPANRGGRLNFGLEDSNDADFEVETARLDFAAGEWVHIGVTWDLGADELQIFVNGALAASENINSTGALGNLESLYFGDNRGDYQVAPMSGDSAEGRFDEIRIYNRVLSASEMAADRDATHPCGVAINHFVITHDGNGINCLAEPITVSARDAANNVLTDYEGTITIDTQSGRGTWTLATGNGTFSDPTADDGLASYTFVAADNGTAIFNLDYREGPSPINILVTDGSVSDDDTEGTLAFGPSGFTVTASVLPNPPPNPINDPVPTQIAGTDFVLHLAAFGQTPTDPECGIIEEYAGNKPVKFWQEYNDPGTGTIVPTIDGNAIASSEAGATDQTVNFTNGQAQVTAKYKDVGRIRINMKDDSVAEPAGGITGATNLFVVQPADFTLSAIERTSDSFANPGAADANGPVFIAAGADFSITVTARDAEGDPTPNYGQENTAEGIRLDQTLVLPAVGNNPAIATGSGFGAFSNGVATGTEFSWPEVGIITLTPAVEDADYLGTGDVTGTASGNIGRFIPFDFDVTQNSPVFGTACGTGYTYIGEGFTYDTVPVLTVTARALGGTTTQNYTGDFFKLTQSSLTTPGGNKGYSTATGTLDTAMVPAKPAVADSGNGVGTLTFSDGGGVTFARTAPEAPFDAEISLAIDVIDEDGVVYGDGAGASLNPARFGQPSPGNGMDFSDGKEQRWGRLRLLNAAGSELLALGLPMRTEYFDGTAFVVNTDDDCSGFAVTDLVLSNDIESGQTDGDIIVSNAPSCTTTGETTASIANNPFVDGDAGLSFSAPGEGCTGYADVTVPLGAQGVSYLQFDWDGDGSHAEDPAGRATFGIFSGPDEFIYIREPW